MNQATQQGYGAGGICGTHGVYDGRRCPKCAKTSALAALGQSVWEADQFLTPDEVRAFVDGTLREIEADSV
jgi:hypothetical protein